MIQINENLTISDDEIEIASVRSSGKGGQNVNKVSTAIHLRFDINNSSLPLDVKEKIMQSGDSRITNDGILVIKSQNSRSRERNLEAALNRLKDFIRKATMEKPPRKPTKPPRRSVINRLENKSHRSTLKKSRKIDPNTI